MNILQAIAKVDKNDPKCQSWADVEDFSRELGLNVYTYTGHQEFSKRMKKYWIHSWCCTDTWVGLAVYEFDGVFVATSFQPYRKSDEKFTWYFQSDVKMVRDYILSLDPASPVHIGRLGDDLNMNELLYGAMPEQAVYSIFKEE